MTCVTGLLRPGSRPLRKEDSFSLSSSRGAVSSHSQGPEACEFGLSVPGTHTAPSPSSSAIDSKQVPDCRFDLCIKTVEELIAAKRDSQVGNDPNTLRI